MPRRRASPPLALLVAAALGLSGTLCDKIPLTDVGAGFALAEAAWFEDEATLFVFYRVEAAQGLGPQSVVELSWSTDSTGVGWFSISERTHVHEHLAVDCGARARCGSASFRVDEPPRAVGLRLRYHRDGPLAIETRPNLNLLGSGPAYAHRSLAVLGVFDATNRRVQWRARHQFPAVRNEDAQGLGLRRWFSVDQAAYGTVTEPLDSNPTGYAFAAACPAELTPYGVSTTTTTSRARFSADELPLQAAAAPHVCARATVRDARGDFVAPALARKNPQVQPAFAALRSPAREARRLGVLLRRCADTGRVESELAHEAMQRQRLLLDTPQVICLDDLGAPAFVERLAALLQRRLEDERTLGEDMVFTIAVHHEERGGRPARALELALERVLVDEVARSTPRAVGAFVFDSAPGQVSSSALTRLVLWCPSNVEGDDLDAVPADTLRSCPVKATPQDIALGPLRFATLPIFPSRGQYATFLERYGEGQGGSMRSLKFLAPLQTAVTEHLPLGDFGGVTFFNSERFTAAPADAFSFCAATTPDAPTFVVRGAESGQPMPASSLPLAHAERPEPAYAIGLYWPNPFLALLEYESRLAGAATVSTLTVPFGVGNIEQETSDARLWLSSEFSVGAQLTQCVRFCDHPTFDTSRVYELGQSFRSSYQERCYEPRFPDPNAPDAQGGFPLDP